jgi:hypothetical protein
MDMSDILPTLLDRLASQGKTGMTAQVDDSWMICFLFDRIHQACPLEELERSVYLERSGSETKGCGST